MYIVSLLLIKVIFCDDELHKAWNLTDPNVNNDSRPDTFGETVLVLDNNWIAVSSRLNNCVYMYFRNSDDTFSLNQTLKGNSSGYGFSLHSVFTRALSQQILVVGSPSMGDLFRKNDFADYIDLCFSELNSQNGSVYIYYFDDSWKGLIFVITSICSFVFASDPTSPWILLTVLTGEHPLYGLSVKASYTGLLVVGSPYVSNNLSLGCVYIYDLNLFGL
jgi:hypothetical protein